LVAFDAVAGHAARARGPPGRRGVSPAFAGTRSPAAEKKKKKKKKREQNDTLTHPRFLEAALVQSKPGVFADSFWPAPIGFDSVRVAKRVAGPTSR
jgi:hypothetical protein